MTPPPYESLSITTRISKSLSDLIRAHIPLLQGSDSSVRFESPAELDGTDEAQLSMYLYQIEINPFLRNLPETIIPVAGSGGLASLQSIPAPLVVDLLYMMVPIVKSPEYEMWIADGLVRLLDTCGTIPEQYLDQTLKETGNDCLQIIPDFTSIHTLRDLWAAFPQKAYRLTKLYRVSPVRLFSGPGRPVDVVAEVDVTVTREAG